MPRRIVIALFAVVVIGVAAYLLSRPRRGSVEYHRKKYFSARNSPGRLGRVEDLFLEHGPAPFVKSYWRGKLKRIEFHRKALVEAGALKEQIFVLSNRPPRYVARTVWSALLDVSTNDHKKFTELWPTDTNALTVTAPAEAMDYLGELIRQVDVPESK